MTKWIIGIALVVIVGIGVWWSGVLGSLMPSAPVVQQQATTTPQQNQQQPVSDLPTQTSDTSDSAMAQDAAAVDAQLQSLSSDSASIGTSLNDKPVSQEF
jgi:cytoskeletal protein RodZ